MHFKPSTASDYGCGGDCGCGPCSQARGNYGGADISAFGIDKRTLLIGVAIGLGAYFFWPKEQAKSTRVHVIGP